MRVFVHGGAATPALLLTELTAQASRLKNVELIHLHTEGPVPYADPRLHESFRVTNLFVGANLRKLLDYEHVDYLPCFLSEIPELFRSGRRPLDAALLHVSLPDQHGNCSLGVSVDVAKAAAGAAKIIIAQVNPHMPRVHGDAWIHVDDIDAMVHTDEPIHEFKLPTPTEAELSIAKQISGLIEDGATLQMGIGNIPDAVARHLTGRKNLGIHTEMWSDGTLALIESGVVNNSQKKFHRGRCVSGFLMGSKRLYDYVNDNPNVIQLQIDLVNSPTVIASNPKVVAINSAVEVDLTGQVCADSVGHQIISGVGGQMDFMRGAALSPGGKPIIAITSTSKKGYSKIVPSLKQGAGVVTTRAHVHYVVTENGVADLHGKTLRERARSLIAIAHPSQQEALDKAFFETHLRRPPVSV